MKEHGAGIVQGVDVHRNGLNKKHQWEVPRLEFLLLLLIISFCLNFTAIVWGKCKLHQILTLKNLSWKYVISFDTSLKTVPTNPFWTPIAQRKFVVPADSINCRRILNLPNKKRKENICFNLKRNQKRDDFLFH